MFMRNISYLALLLFVGSWRLSGQVPTEFIVKPGQPVSEVITPAVLYRFPQFTSGKVHLVGGRMAEAKLNYNRFSEEVEFIDSKGDTLEIAEKITIRLITILDDSFYFDNGYVELIQDYGRVKLALHEQLRLTSSQKVGAFGQKNGGVGIESLTAYTSDQNTRIPLIANEELKFKIDRLYFLNKSGSFYFPANKKNILKEFSKYRKALQDYFSKNNFDPTDKKDVERLCVFIQSLPAGN